MALLTGLILLTCTIFATEGSGRNGSGNSNDVSTCSYDLVLRGCNLGQNPTDAPQSNIDDHSARLSVTERLINQMLQRTNSSVPRHLLQKIIQSHLSSSVERKLTKMMESFQHKVTRMLRKMESRTCCGNVPENASNSTGERSIKTSQNTGVCPQGFEGFENWVSCYKFSTFNTTWAKAMEYCSAMGGSLVKICTTREHFILSFLLNNNQEFGHINSWWTSGHYFVGIKEWAWAKMVKYETFRFTNWPNGAPMPREESCMYLDKTNDYQWGSAHCHERKNFICEVPSKIWLNT
ncbi:C-type lectin domain family 10 member A [Lingula anatina]|uniref:C-type lectin domain family 10 member A n=1 Tax=Lingula anatina TaxID=7574 RepID=A0A1S3I052_LINAN|nr:C-type lectin domain family 10 member A [Lingula anatina]|eukprot:XP_013391640.1 C-type lectin domain family 10 member A [Lingula anatina]